MEVEDRSEPLNLPPDRRPTIPQPLPVRLIAVSDVAADAIAGQETAMDALYVNLLGFQRSASPGELRYHADNADLHFVVREPLFHRDDLRPIQIEVNSLASLQQLLIEGEIEHVRQKALSAGQESLILQDPSGNWLEVTERRQVA